MFLSHLDIENFRNYQSASICFSERYNVLLGSNGQGKTNLIEAIFLLCLSRSFRASSDNELKRFGQEGYCIRGQFRSDRGSYHEAAVAFAAGSAKEIHVDRKRIARTADLIGLFPVVLFSPGHYAITLGAPSQRRRFVDTLLAQSSPKYLRAWQAYLRVVRQRNAILSQADGTQRQIREFLEPWDAKLLDWGAEVIEARRTFVDDFSMLLHAHYVEITNSTEDLRFRYVPGYIDPMTAEIRQALGEALERARSREAKRRITTIGPHRDDFEFLLNGVDLRKYGSRGEHKSVLMACKLAEFDFLERKRAETPILLLDDVFSELDAGRRTNVWRTVIGRGQVFVTAANDVDVVGREQAKVLRIEAGRVFTSASN